MANVNILGCLSVFIGGGIGAVLRYLGGIQAAKLWGTNFPYGTLLINIGGSFLIGLLAACFIMGGDSGDGKLRLFLIVGVLGGFTTFSSFSLETLMMLNRGQIAPALAYIFSSVGLSLIAVFLGFQLIKAGLS